MSLQERIFNDLKSAMKEKDEVRVRTLRMVVTAIQYYLVDHESLSDEEMTMLGGLIEKANA
ncbi:MAG TPA: GatB/YqeY domain-containing protein, partial [Thermotogota bacterium]|nr:GatB/YqeY domain-containing protein [Thermotogota bacterium]